LEEDEVGPAEAVQLVPEKRLHTSYCWFSFMPVLQVFFFFFYSFPPFVAFLIRFKGPSSDRFQLVEHRLEQAEHLVPPPPANLFLRLTGPLEHQAPQLFTVPCWCCC
jgi:hypothetical protein